MWLSPEDARSDFILAMAALVFGSGLYGLVTSLPFYPDGGLVFLLLLPLWVLLVTAYPAWWLVRYRGQGVEGHGLVPQGRGALVGDGLLLAGPVVVAGYGWNLLGAGGVGTGPLDAALGLAATLFRGGTIDRVTGLALALLLMAAVAVGTVLLWGMLAARAGDAFRSPDMPLVEAVRTFGMGTVAAATVLGLLVALRGDRSLLGLALEVVPLLLLVLLVDRLVTRDDRVERAAVVAPLVAAVVAAMIIGGGGLLFGSDLLGGLYRGALAGGLTVVAAALVATRRHAWALLPLLVAAAWSPSCLRLPSMFSLCPL